MAENECVEFYEPGRHITCQATGAVTGKRFLKISGNRVSGPGLTTATDGSNYRVAQADAGGRAAGVSKYDAANGAKVGLITGGVVPVTAGAAITAFDEVEVDATGRAIPCANGVAVGVALTAASGADVDAEIMLYGSPTIGLPDSGNGFAQGTPQANIADLGAISAVSAPADISAAYTEAEVQALRDDIAHLNTRLGEARTIMNSILDVLDEYGMTL